MTQQILTLYPHHSFLHSVTPKSYYIQFGHIYFLPSSQRPHHSFNYLLLYTPKTSVISSLNEQTVIWMYLNLANDLPAPRSPKSIIQLTLLIYFIQHLSRTRVLPCLDFALTIWRASTKSNQCYYYNKTSENFVSSVGLNKKNILNLSTTLGQRMLKNITKQTTIEIILLENGLFFRI